MRTLCLICTIWLVTATTQAQQLKLSDPEKSVIQVAVVLADKTVVPCGSGFFIRNDGTIITAFHVYAQAIQVISEKRGGVLVARRIVRTEGGGGNFTMAGIDLKAIDAMHDLAVLRIVQLDQKGWDTVGGIIPLPIFNAQQIDTGVSVRVVGYFGTDALPVTLRASLVGGASIVIPPGTDIEEFIVSASAVPGESGSPVILDDGSVLGVVLSIVPVSVPFANQPIPSGLNRVAKAEFLQRLVSSLPK